jgi:hypothetical protein
MRAKTASAASAGGASAAENNYLGAGGCGHHADSTNSMRTAASASGLPATRLKNALRTARTTVCACRRQRAGFAARWASHAIACGGISS